MQKAEVIEKPMAGIYIHIPFCKSKCGYCAFNSEPLANPDELDRYAKALVAEIRTERPWLLRNDIDTIYFGGGTPSLLNPDQIRQIIDELADSSKSISANAEITAEANPDSLTPDKLRGFADAGVNRLSIGIQSFDSAALNFLERIHTPSQADRVIKQARDEGFINLSLDLIIGLPEPFTDIYKDDLSKAVAHSPEHLSVYLLTATAPARLFESVDCGDVVLPDSDKQADLFLWADHFLTQAGYAHYEVSNYCRPGFLARHNSAYWQGTPYLGLGAGAHSYLTIGEQHIRRANLPDSGKYADATLSGKTPVDFFEMLTATTRMKERLMLLLRTTGEIVPDDFAPHAKVIAKKLQEFAKSGWYTPTDRGFTATPEGLLVADGLCEALWDVFEEA
jgi:oxygen-independent coproporphyrinogen-3 oxidase